MPIETEIKARLTHGLVRAYIYIQNLQLIITILVGVRIMATKTLASLSFHFILEFFCINPGICYLQYYCVLGN
jgi:hypothetical protein